MGKTLVKNGRRILGFVWQKEDGTYWYAFGRPSADQYIAFGCNSIEQGIARVKMHTNHGNI